MLNYDVGNLLKREEYANGSGHFYKRTTDSVDETFGFRKSTPMMVEVPDLRPILNLNCRYHPAGGSGWQTVIFPRPIKNIMKVWLNWISITGIVGIHDNLCIEFEDSVHQTFNIGSSTVNAGFGVQTGNMIPIPCLGATDLTYRDGYQRLLGSFRQIKNLESLGIKLTDAAGASVAYDECILSLSLDVETYQ